MNKKLLIAVFCIMFLFSGCGRKMVDYMYTTEIVYRNNTEHTIMLKTYNPVNLEKISVQIEGGSSSSFHIDNEGDFCRNVPMEATVTFDGQYRVDMVMGEDIPNNICNNANYINTCVSEFKLDLQYTFTEADYEYAVSAGGSGKEEN